MALYLVKVVKTVTLLVQADRGIDIPKVMSSDESSLDLEALTEDSPDVVIEVCEEIKDSKLVAHIDGFIYDNTFFPADAPTPDEIEMKRLNEKPN